MATGFVKGSAAWKRFLEMKRDALIREADFNPNLSRGEKNALFDEVLEIDRELLAETKKKLAQMSMPNVECHVQVVEVL